MEKIASRKAQSSPSDPELRTPVGTSRLDSFDGRYSMHSDRKSPFSLSTSSNEEGGFISSSSFDNSSTGSSACSDMPTKKNFTRKSHSEIEKRRRKKINKLIGELAEIVPMCSNSNRKPDKLTVLKMAVQHIGILRHREEQRVSIGERYKPSFLTETEMENLLEKAVGGFIFAVNTDRFQIIYVSDTVKDCLTHSPADLVGKSLLDVIQARDVQTLREQLTPVQSLKSPHSPRCLYNLYESDAESTRIFVSNCRRAFFCRFRNHLLEEDATGDKTFGPLHKKSRSKPYQPGNEDLNDYSIIHCIGFLKSWQPADPSLFTYDNEMPSSACLFAVCKKVKVLAGTQELQSLNTTDFQHEFTCRCSGDGRYLHVDPRIVPILGHLPQDLLGNISYQFIHDEDRRKVQTVVEDLLKRKSTELVVTDTYRMVARDGILVPIVTALFCFFNPVTNDLEYIVQQSSVFQSAQDTNNQEPSFLTLSSHQEVL